MSVNSKPKVKKWLKMINFEKQVNFLIFLCILGNKLQHVANRKKRNSDLKKTQKTNRMIYLLIPVGTQTKTGGDGDEEIRTNILGIHKVLV